MYETSDPNAPTGTQESTPSNEAPPASPPSGQQAQPPAPGGNAKVMTIPTNVMSRIKKEEREKGRKAALAELDAQAKSLGYKSWEDMKTNHAARSAKPAQQRQEQRPAQQPQREARPAQEQRPAGQPGPRQLTKLERENAKLLEERKRLNRARAQDERRIKAMEQERDAREARHELEMAALAAGVKPGIAMRTAIDLLTEETQRNPPSRETPFDEKAWFGNLREQAPWLFGVEERPANTGAGAPSGPGAKPPASPQGKQPGPNGGPVNAMKMSKQEYDDYLRSRGITPPNGSYPT